MSIHSLFASKWSTRSVELSYYLMIDSLNFGGISFFMTCTVNGESTCSTISYRPHAFSPWLFLGILNSSFFSSLFECDFSRLSTSVSLRSCQLCLLLSPLLHATDLRCCSLLGPSQLNTLSLVCGLSFLPIFSLLGFDGLVLDLAILSITGVLSFTWSWINGGCLESCCCNVFRMRDKFWCIL